MSNVIGHLTNKSKGIIENTMMQYIEFYVAGYTKKCKDVSVQSNHARLFSEARQLCNQEDATELVWPFGERDSSLAKVDLMPESTNSYDPNAMIVIVEYPRDIKRYLQDEEGSKSLLLLGYVPMVISNAIAKKHASFEPGWIKKVKLLGNKTKTLCSTKVAIPWKTLRTDVDIDNIERMRILADELE